MEEETMDSYDLVVLSHTDQRHIFNDIFIFLPEKNILSRKHIFGRTDL